MCPHGYHHSGFMETPALGTQDVRYQTSEYLALTLSSFFIFHSLWQMKTIICEFLYRDK